MRADRSTKLPSGVGANTVITSLIGSILGAVLAFAIAQGLGKKPQVLGDSLAMNGARFFLVSGSTVYRTDGGLIVAIEAGEELAPNLPIIKKLSIIASRAGRERVLLDARDLAWGAAVEALDVENECWIQVKVKMIETPDGPKSNVILGMQSRGGTTAGNCSM